MKIVIVLGLFVVAVSAGAILPLNQISKPLPTLHKINLGRPSQTIQGVSIKPIKAIKPIQVIQAVPVAQKIKIQRLPVRRNIYLQKPLQTFTPIRTVVKTKGIPFFV